ncbi:DUF6294 family protein [Nocardia sp. NPDC051321]|uniref:DUF6294 family protein n=1 Tax=Nocardia sp. NPDC051321 TaxID=3364323 RepID=UPI00378C7C2C
MTTAFRRTLVRLAVCIGLASATALTTMPVGHADPDKVFTWGDITVGDCTMFQGARWVLHSDGYAEFNGLVTSGSDNDAWLMHAALFDANHRYLGNIVNNWATGGDLGKFVLNLPSSAQRYNWDLDKIHNAQKTYPPEAFRTVTRIELQNHC